MKTRCYNKNRAGYKDYGGRGIIVCQRWLDSFENFLSDMGLRPSPKHSLDRINNDGNYEPGNCRWATRKEQCGNSRNNVLVTIHGETRILTEWCRAFGVSISCVKSRVRRTGATLEQALLVPAGQGARLHA